MSLEQEILDRLEKRNAQIAQLQSTIQALERAADTQREHARQQLAPLNEENARLQNIINDLERSADASSKQERETYDALVAYNKKMRAQIESAQLEREQMQHQITELRSERDRILEISKSLVPKSALKQAVMEAAGLSSEVAKLRGLQNEIVRLNAKLGPLEALYKTLKGYHDNNKIIGHGSIIKVAIDVATEALSQLTA